MNIKYIIILILVVLYSGFNAFADNYTKNDVRHYILSVENKLKEIKKDGASAYALKDVQSIDNLVREAKKYLADKKFERAYYIINIAKKYFEKIKAIKNLDRAKNKYDSLQTKINNEKNKNNENTKNDK